MALAITDFFQVMQRRDFLRDHQYRISALAYNNISLTPDDLVYLRTAEIPNRTINSVAVPFMGLNFSVPGTAQYAGTIDVAFYCDQPQILRSIFEALSFSTFDDRTSGGNYTVSDDNRLTFFTYNNQPAPNGGNFQPTTVYTLHGIYPTTVGAISMDTTGNGTALNFTATLAYQFWRKEESQYGSFELENNTVNAALRVPTP